VYEVDASRRMLTSLADRAPGTEPRGRWSSIPLSTVRPTTLAVHERRPQWFEDLDAWLATHPGQHPELVENMRLLGMPGGVALPLIVAGTVVGVVGIGFTTPRRLTSVERSTLLALAEQGAQALDRARLYRSEQGIAETLQRSLLPQQLPLLSRLALAARYLPGAAGTRAGGDWYDVVELTDTCVAIAVGDVVGQGPAAAAVMGQLRSALSTALLTGNSPAQALELLDRFAARLPGATASTAACLIVDWGRGVVRWASAGHLPPLLASGGEVRFLDGLGGTVLGVPGRRPFTEGTAEIEPGAVVLLYTDGLVERRGETLDAGLDRLANAFRRHGAEPPDRLASLLVSEILADTDQPDDVALIAARLAPPPLGQRLPADPARLAAVRRAVVGWATEAGLPDIAIEDLQLALGEAVANGVEHAYRDQPPGTCAFSLARRPDGGVDVQVQDFGTWRPAPSDAGFRGRGIQLIRRLAEDVHIEATPGGGTTVRFRIPVHDAAPDESGAHRHVPSPGAPVQPAALHAGDSAVELAGELDLASVRELRAELFAALADLHGDVAVDLRRVTYLASAGLGLLLEAAQRTRSAGNELRVLLDPDGHPARVLELAGLDALLGAAGDDRPVAH
jgi:anti-anti-sigma factor